MEREAEIRDGDGEEVVVECADDCSRVGMGCICRRPRGELRFSVGLVPFRLVFGDLNRGRARERERRGEEAVREKRTNAQFLKIIERRYVLWMEPLVKKEDVEESGQGQDSK